jgi:hypothetical protein
MSHWALLYPTLQCVDRGCGLPFRTTPEHSHQRLSPFYELGPPFFHFLQSFINLTELLVEIVVISVNLRCFHSLRV